MDNNQNEEKPPFTIPVFNYHEETREYLGVSQARRDPEEPEPIYLIPRNATAIAPPDFGANEIPVFDPEAGEQGEWTVKPDHRGEKYFRPDGSFVVIVEIGVEKEDDWTIERPETWDSVRLKRDELLKESDWTQLGDAPLSSSKKQEWAAYRQTLRDITEGDDPNAVEWPDKPA